MNLESIIISFVVAIVGYFLKATMDDLKRVKDISYDTKNKLSVIENDYLNKHSALSDKFDALCDSVKDLTNEIKLLNREFKKKE